MTTDARPRLRILFVLKDPEYLRYYDTTMRLLADRGHKVAVAVNILQKRRKYARLELIDDDRIGIAGLVPKRVDVWTPFVRAVRRAMDVALYLHPRYADMPALRTRMCRRMLPPLVRGLCDRSLSESRLTTLVRLLRTFEQAVPVSPKVGRFLRTERPDLVFVSPVVDIASDQVDTVRAAHAAGIPVIAGIASWDNLSSKGHLRVEPDAVIVWNRHQQSEAVELHGIPPERVVVTGAQVFDAWFERQPSMSRQAFCQTVGLPDDRPFILFTGSSRFQGLSRHQAKEAEFVRDWIRALRASDDPLLRDVGVLLRPHPFKPPGWKAADFADVGPVAIWPRGGGYTPAAEESRTSLFDSLYYCDAVMGINTSAMIDAAVLRKPVLSLLSPTFSDMQDGTMHFRYLRAEKGGFLRLASSIEQHLDQLAAVLRDSALVTAQTEQFVAAFVRPHGTATSCAPLLADAVERVAWNGPLSSRSEGTGTHVLRAAFTPVAGVMWLWNAARQGKIRLPSMSIPADVTVSLRNAPKMLNRGVRIRSHRARRQALRVPLLAARKLRRLPAFLLRRVRHARYYVATVVLQRAAKNGGNRA